MIKKLLARTCVLLLVTAALFFSPLNAAPTSIGYSAGNSSGNSGTPGLKLTLPAITDPEQSAWELTSFTWLSTSGSGANATGRGYLLIFDADPLVFTPEGKTAATVNETTTGLIATSAAYADGAYSFSSAVILEAGKSYYFLNSMAITTSLAPAAPYDYGFNSSVVMTGIERWVVASGTWASRGGAPNFSATFVPTSVPEPATAVALLGFTGLAAAVSCRRRRS